MVKIDENSSYRQRNYPKHKKSQKNQAVNLLLEDIYFEKPAASHAVF